MASQVPICENSSCISEFVTQPNMYTIMDLMQMQFRTDIELCGITIYKVSLRGESFACY